MLNHIYINLCLQFLTCLVGRRLCDKPEENHWQLRDYSAKLIAHICNIWGTSYSTLQPRITKTLISAFLDPSKPLTTHYGAIVGLTFLGYHVIQLLILPNLRAYIRLLSPELQSTSPNKLLEATKVHGALLRATGVYYRKTVEEYIRLNSTKSTEDLPEDIKKQLTEFKDILGDAIIPYLDPSYEEPNIHLDEDDTMNLQ